MSPVLTKAKAAKKPARVWSDERLVKECLAGNEEAWSFLIEKYKALIYSIPIKYRLPPHEAAEVFQATCVELLQHLTELREPRALPKWLMQVAHHQCFRYKKQQQRLVSRDGDADLPEPETPAIAETLLQQTQEEQMLREAMAALSPQCRRLVDLLFYETPARTYSEVAAELGLAVGSIGFTRQKCMDRLRKHLGDMGFD
jgi:RNA polymerase sigma factor (sigma-70 family)